MRICQCKKIGVVAINLVADGINRRPHRSFGSGRFSDQHFMARQGRGHSVLVALATSTS